MLLRMILKWEKRTWRVSKFVLALANSEDLFQVYKMLPTLNTVTDLSWGDYFVAILFFVSGTVENMKEKATLKKGRGFHGTRLWPSDGLNTNGAVSFF